MRRVITQARERGTSKKLVVSSHQASSFAVEIRKPFSAVSAYCLMNSQASFLLGERGRADVDAEHGPKPQIFADALMHHLLMDTAARGSSLPGTNRQDPRRGTRSRR